MKKIKIALVVLIIVAITCLGILVNLNNTEVKRISSEKELLEIMEGKKKYEGPMEDIMDMLVEQSESLFEIMGYTRYKSVNYRKYPVVYDTMDLEMEAGTTTDSIKTSTYTNKVKVQGSKDYSKTNIQVENVDEADITKTDGDYIYSISDYNVIITDVRNPNDIKIASRINTNSKYIPVDLMLYGNKLVVIYEIKEGSGYYSNSETLVKTYNISSKDSPKEIKSFRLNQTYYTSRCIDNKLFIIASGELGYDDEDSEKVDRSYEEDGERKNINLNSIKYLKDVPTDIMTLIVCEDLDEPSEDIKINPFLMDVSNAYVSEKSIYLLNETYGNSSDSSTSTKLKNLFSFRGLKAFLEEEFDNHSSSSRELYTEIYKFGIQKDGDVNFIKMNKVDGKTINQYSLDEKDGHFRIATYEYSKGAKVTILDENLSLIGESARVGKNENMYATRFMGDKAYVVTYRTVDPLFVIDLSNERHPKVLGELSIPGYSMYLHPYDENHVIGIGMETVETINKDRSGRVSSTTARITGMKMALFDVSDVRNPKQISQVVIGDSRTTSAILENPKALLFSKEKEIIAIPVNNFDKDFDVENDEGYEDTIKAYNSVSRSRISEGYMVFKIDLEEGFVKKGTIVHEPETKPSSSYYYSSSSNMLRGLYIENNLYTISENQIKVNSLDTLEQINQLIIKDSNNKMTNDDIYNLYME